MNGLGLLIVMVLMNNKKMARTNNTFYASDLVSGVAVFLVALPLCLGIALASDAPLISGLISGIIGGVVIGWLSGSHTSVSGPAAGLTAVVASQIASLGSFEAFLAALVVAGLIQIILGLLRMGFVADYFPSSVIRGLLAAIGVILIIKQSPHLIGWHQDAQVDELSIIGQVFSHIGLGAALIGVISLALMFTWDRVPWLKKIKLQPSLVVVVLGVALSVTLSFFSESLTIAADFRVQVPVIKDLSLLSSFIRSPDFSAFLRPEVYVASMTLALVASLETMLNLGAVDKIDPYKRISPPNRELIAQGIGNALLGFVGGLPATSVIIRSSVNINANAKTKVSAIAHGVFLLLFTLLVPDWLNAIPLSCLAAVLIVTGWKLASPKVVFEIWRQGINQFLPFIITVMAIVATNLLTGIMAGLAVSLAFRFITARVRKSKL